VDPKKKILVVEDNPDTLQLMVLVLSREGYQVAEAVT
jgi:CheY-like chemotaxis protein